MEDLTRRRFIQVAGAAAAGLGSAALAAPPPADRAPPWFERVRRWGQVNINEDDAADLDVERWVAWWASIGVEGLTVSCGGIVAFYPTRLPFHVRVACLGERDLFGEFAAAARRRGLRILARLDPTHAGEEALRERPEWFAADRAGKPIPHSEASWIYRTCPYGPYFTEQMAAIVREVRDRYDPDGFYTNGWPGSGLGSPCRCARCRDAFRSKTGADLPEREDLADPLFRRFSEMHLERVLEVWRLWEGAAREGRADRVYVGNLGGGVGSRIDLRRVAAVASWYNADHQDRPAGTPIWDCAQEGKAARALMGGRTATCVTSAYPMGDLVWRHTAKPAAELTLRLAETAASGMVPWLTWLGGKPEDRRWMAPAEELYRWLSRNDLHFRNRRSLATVGLVWSRSSLVLHTPRPPVEAAARRDAFQGAYRALLEARIPFDLVMEEDLAAGDAAGAGRLSELALLVLPDVAVLPAAAAAGLHRFAASGGSLVATFESSAFGADGARLPAPALADLLGLAPAAGRAPVEGPRSNGFLRIEAPHPLTDGFEGTTLLPAPRFSVPIAANSGRASPLSRVPPYPAFPPEMVHPRAGAPASEGPFAVTGEGEGGGRSVYLAGDVDATYWRTSSPDLGRLLANAVRWAARGRLAVTVEGPGVLDLFAWETEAGLALHLVNLTNPGLWRGPVREIVPVGAQRVSLRLPAGFRPARVELLRRGMTVPHRESDGAVTFEVPGIADLETAAVLPA